MFSPYHQFKNCTKLVLCVQRLYDASCVPPHIHDWHHNYHEALEQKLRGAKHNLDALRVLISSTDITTIASSTNMTTVTRNIQDFMFHANLYIDGFFYNGGSALDILAREVLTIFDIYPSGHVYYDSAYSEISSKYPSDPILTRLNDPFWKQEFSDYRNASTHEVLLSTEGNLNFQLSSEGLRQSIRLPLPDNPRAALSTRTYNKNPDALQYCILSFRRLLRHINAIYGDAYTRASTQGKLPLP